MSDEIYAEIYRFLNNGIYCLCDFDMSCWFLKLWDRNMDSGSSAFLVWFYVHSLFFWSVGRSIGRPTVLPINVSQKFLLHFDFHKGKSEFWCKVFANVMIFKIEKKMPHVASFNWIFFIFGRKTVDQNSEFSWKIHIWLIWNFDVLPVCLIG